MEESVESMYKKLISRIHREVLKPAGFKKDGSNFRICYVNGLGKIINFQRSMFNCNAECKFCINMGLYTQQDGEKPNPRFKEYDCAVRERAAFISPRYGKDYWWCIFEGRDMEKLFGEMQAILTEDVLPWMDRFESRQDVIRAGQRGELRGIIWRNI